MHHEDTIAAIATPAGEGGIAIVRLSGPEVFRIADEIFAGSGAPPSKMAAQTFAYGTIHEGEEVIDEVLLLVMRSPQSFTGEDVVEIQGHGGGVVAQRVLRRVLAAGARPAEPGEFSQRAFLNGRIDLVQAEGILDLIHAQSERAAAAAMEQLEGGLSQKFNAIYDEMLGVCADLEATLDFPEDELPETAMADIRQRLQEITERQRDLISTWTEGRLLREGARVVLSGLPNVGKSTLLNALLESNRAIVSNVPGTTRDSIEEVFVLNGVPLKLVDTAGLRETDCEVEQEGISRSRQQMGVADFHIHLLDASVPLGEEARASLASLPADRCLVVLNKRDLGSMVGEGELDGFTVISASLKFAEGLDEIKQALTLLLQKNTDLARPPHAVISERHRQLLVQAQAELDEATRLVNERREDLTVLAADRIREALTQLGRVTGRVFEEELVNNIFARFCIGK